MTYALVTGASKGIGKAIAEELAKKKFNILLIARSEELLKKNAAGISAKYDVAVDYYATDLSSTNAAKEIFNWCTEKKYTVQILVNNAGYGLSGPFERFSVDENINMMQLNMIAIVQLTQLFLPVLKSQNKSYILNISSSAAYQAVPYLSVYSATKAFVLSFSRGLRQELKKTSVSVTCISPGSTDTGFATRAQLGEKGLKTAEKVNMSPETVAAIAVQSTLTGKAEVIIGLINKLGAFMAWLLPKSLVERTAMKIYE